MSTPARSMVILSKDKFYRYVGEAVMAFMVLYPKFLQVLILDSDSWPPEFQKFLKQLGQIYSTQKLGINFEIQIPEELEDFLSKSIKITKPELNESLNTLITYTSVEDRVIEFEKIRDSFSNNIVTVSNLLKSFIPLYMAAYVNQRTYPSERTNSILESYSKGLARALNSRYSFDKETWEEDKQFARKEWMTLFNTTKEALSIFNNDLKIITHSVVTRMQREQDRDQTFLLFLHKLNNPKIPPVFELSRLVLDDWPPSSNSPSDNTRASVQIPPILHELPSLRAKAVDIKFGGGGLVLTSESPPNNPANNKVTSDEAGNSVQTTLHRPRH